MKNFFYWLGKSLQVSALVLMPFAFWASQIRRDEKGSITIFLSSIVIFGAGTLLTAWAQKL